MIKRPDPTLNRDNPAKPADGFAHAPVGRPALWFFIVGLVLLALASYYPIFHNGYITFDDNLYIYQNPAVLQAEQGITHREILWAFTSINVSNWHPLTMLSHMLDAWAFGVASPGAHHAVSLLFHGVNSLLLFWFFVKTTGRVGPAFMVAAFFAVHPIHVESVAWASSRKDVLSFFFVMLTLLGYARWVGRGRRWTDYIPVAVGFACALMSKPTAVTLPALLLLVDFWPLNRAEGQASQPGSFAQSLKAYTRSLPRLMLEKVPLLLLAGVMSAVTFLVQRSTGAVAQTDQIPLDARLANIPVAYARYLKKLLWPDDLAVLYPHPVYWPTATVVLSALLLVIITCAVFYGANRFNKKYLPVGWCWFLGVLVPMIGLVHVGSQSMADRYGYISFIGLYVLIVWTTADLLKHARMPRAVPVALCGLVLLPLVITTQAQAARWASPTILYEHGVSVTQNNYFLLNNLGEVYLTQNQLPKAHAALEQALAINPNLKQGHENLGLVCFMMGDPARAALHLQKAVDLGSTRQGTLLNLGWALSESGQHARALDRFESLIKTNGPTADVLTGKAAALAGLEKHGEAERLFAQVHLQWPGYTPAYYHHARLLLKTGKPQEAEAMLTQLVRAEPTNVPAILLLAEALTKNKKPGQAQLLLDEAAKRLPGDKRIEKARMALL